MRRNRARTGGSAPFDLTVRRRREIESHANYIGAAETEDFWRWIVAWIWHNKDASALEVINAAKRMRRNITEAEAVEMLALAASERRHMTAERLGRFLGLTYAQRQFIGITTIWCTDVNKRERKAMRREKDRLYRERRRRARGARPQADSIAAQARKEGVSRMTIYRRRKAAAQTKNAPHVTLSSAADSSTGVDTPVTRGTKGSALRAAPQVKERVLNHGKRESSNIGEPARLRAGIIAADGVGRIGDSPESPESLGRSDSLPIELRMMALCLPFEPARLREAA